LLDLQPTALVGAVITLSELLAEEYKERGISFNVLALGAVQTEMLEEAFLVIRHHKSERNGGLHL
jgi:NAD(P)-dependent dehydrogenase (short-subunit alcohol dehydrogenase family)